MSNAKNEKPAPEAELQAQIGAVIKKAFPGHKLRYETRFTLGLGRESITIDGVAGWEKTGRADIIVYNQTRAVAVVELKREDVKLDESGRKQLLTYACQLSPRPPLLVLTNGQDIKFFDGNDGRPLDMKKANAATVGKLFENAAKIAAADHDWTMETLLGVGTSTWAGFVRNRSQKVINRLTGSRAEVGKPFADDLLFSRLLAYRVAKALKQGAPAIMIEGAPLAGKSSLLRELSLRNSDEDLAILFIRAGSGGAGLFQRIANLFGEAVEWRFDEQDARSWLRRLSNSDPSIRLILAVDDLTPGSAVESDLEELADAGFGSGLGILATVTSDEARRGANSRDETALEQLAWNANLKTLNNAEFAALEKTLAERRIQFTHGAALSPEYRIPWILRAMLAVLPPEIGVTQGVTFPATLSFDFVENGRKLLARFPEAQRGYRLLSRDAFGDEGPFSPEFVLAMSHAFIIRRDALSAESRDVLSKLIDQGWVSAMRHSSGEDVLIPRAPEMFLGAFAEEVSHHLEQLAAETPIDAGGWLASAMDGVYLGDLVGAQAVLDMSKRRNGFPVGILSGLVECEPELESFSGACLGLPQEDGTIQNVHITAEGELFEADEHGNRLGEALCTLPAEERILQGNMAGWQILSQLAMIRSESIETGAMAHPGILLRVGTSKVPLIRMAGEPQLFATREIEGHGTLVDIENGIVEGVTAALQQMFMRDWKTLDRWFAEALASGSVPLLYRIRTALAACRDIAAEPAASWIEARGHEVNEAMHALI